MTLAPYFQPERDIIIALFHRIEQQSELKEAWRKLPNAERSAMAGDFYNIVKFPADSEALLGELIGMFDDVQYCGITVKQMLCGKWGEIKFRQQQDHKE